MKNKPFSLRARQQSINYAIKGILTFLKKEHNAIIHLVATITVLILAIILKVNRLEIILLLFVTGLVWICEMINTAIENMMDFITTEKLPQIKFIKDVSAGAVLIFIPKL